MTTLLRMATLALAATVPAVAPAAANAQTVRHGPSALYHGLLRPPSRPMRPSGDAHAVFGTITRITKTTFVVRLRSGRPLTVDASKAIAAGRFSSPLFVGKAVLLTGSLDKLGVFTAQTVSRVTRLDASTAGDR